MIPTSMATLFATSMNATAVSLFHSGKAVLIKTMLWVLPPLSNSWIRSIIWLYIALNRTPSTDCYWGVQYPNYVGAGCEVETLKHP